MCGHFGSALLCVCLCVYTRLYDDRRLFFLVLFVEIRSQEDVLTFNISSRRKTLVGFEPSNRNLRRKKTRLILIDLDYISATCVTGSEGVDICDRIQWITWPRGFELCVSVVTCSI